MGSERNRVRPDWHYEQSAVVPYRWRDGELEFLLITSRRRKRWIVPKGIREPHLTPADSAAREAREEAGVEGPVSAEPVGRYEYRKWGGTCRVEVYTQEVESMLERWPEQFRDRRWMTPEEAAERVREADLQDLLRSVGRRLARPPGG